MNKFILTACNQGKSLLLYNDAISLLDSGDVFFISSESVSVMKNTFEKLLTDMRVLSEYDFTKNKNTIINTYTNNYIKLIKYNKSILNNIRGHSIEYLIIDNFDSLFKDEEEKKEFLNCVLPCITAHKDFMLKIASNKPIIL